MTMVMIIVILYKTNKSALEIENCRASCNTHQHPWSLAEDTAPYQARARW